MHFQRGHGGDRAITYLQHAADNARRRSAFVEARAHFDRALVVLEQQPPGVERTEREMTLRIGLGAVVMATEGWGSAAAERAYARARALGQQLGDTPRLFPALWGLWLFYWGRGQLATARDIADGLLPLAGKQDDRGLLLQAHHAAWATAFSQGRLDESQAHAAKGVELYEAAAHAGMASTYGSHDAGVCAMQFNARALALTGRTEEALRMSDAAVLLARSLGHAFSEALALIFAAAVRQALRDVSGTKRCAAQAMAIAREHDFRLLSAWAVTLEGWADVEEGQGAPAVHAIADGLRIIRASGSTQFLTHYLGLYADACLRHRQAADGLAAVAEALGLVEQTGERFYEAELHRLKGELELLTRSNRDTEA
jgi:predicted ATPase